ncbi:unnamed protein product [Auanema sp. JU1783]|nr:unnamed protein product [Auanema sp. JU1783]
MTDSQSEFVRVLTIKAANGEERRMQFPVKLDLLRPKRPRTTFTDEQLATLEDAFRTNGYLTGASRSQLAEKLGLSDTQVKVWFQNRRTKDRRKVPLHSKSIGQVDSSADKKEHTMNTSMSFPILAQNSLNAIPGSSSLFYPNVSFPNIIDYTLYPSSNTLTSLYFRSCS